MAENVCVCLWVWGKRKRMGQHLQNYIFYLGCRAAISPAPSKCPNVHVHSFGFFLSSILFLSVLCVSSLAPTSPPSPPQKHQQHQPHHFFWHWISSGCSQKISTAAVNVINTQTVTFCEYLKETMWSLFDWHQCGMGNGGKWVETVSQKQRTHTHKKRRAVIVVMIVVVSSSSSNEMKMKTKAKLKGARERICRANTNCARMSHRITSSIRVLGCVCARYWLEATFCDKCKSKCIHIFIHK